MATCILKLFHFFVLYLVICFWIGRLVEMLLPIRFMKVGGYLRNFKKFSCICVL